MGYTLSSLFCVMVIIASTRGAPAKRNVDPALVPQFGVQAGINPTGTGNCDGITNAAGQVVKIPCSCPPDRNMFLQSLDTNVAAGKVVNNPSVAVSFPMDNSTASQLTRVEAAIVTLQNLKGPGIGCPAASTTFVVQREAIQNSGNRASPSPVSPSKVATAPAASTSLASQAPVSGGVDPALVPQFGVQAGVNPTGTGDCDGITNPAGQIVKIPCTCPPDRTTFIKALSANVAAGSAVNNPTVQVSFPTDNSKQSQAARIVASLITLQNINGTGKGCPAASTTFSVSQPTL